MAWGNLYFLIPLPSTLPIPLSSYQFHFLSFPPLPVPFSFLFMWVFETCQRQSPTPSGHLFRVELFQKPWVSYVFFPWSLPSFPLVFICLRIPRKLWIWHRCSTVRMNYTLTVKGGSRLNIYIYTWHHPKRKHFSRQRHPSKFSTGYYYFHFNLSSLSFLSVIL